MKQEMPSSVGVPHGAEGSQDAYSMFQSSRRSRPSGRGANHTVSVTGEVAPLVISENLVPRIVERNVAHLRAQKDQQQSLIQNQQRSRTTTSMSGRKSAADAVGGQPSTPAPPGQLGKSALDLMRPTVSRAVQSNDQVSKSLDPRKDVVVSFMEICVMGSGVVPDATIVQVLEQLTNAAGRTKDGAGTGPGFVDIMLRAPADFFRVWSLIFPFLSNFSETSPVFEGAVSLLRRVGEIMQEQDRVLSMQLLLDVALPQLSVLLSEAPGKREHLCGLTSVFVQIGDAARSTVLARLKEHLAKNSAAFVMCLANFAALEAQSTNAFARGPQGEPDDAYSFFLKHGALALQQAQPRVRVAGLAIFASILGAPNSDYTQVDGVLPQIECLADDDWWEVRAQLLVVSARFLGRLFNDQSQSEEHEIKVERLLSLVHRVFSSANSTNLRQVGLFSVAPLLSSYPALLPSYLDTLLKQPLDMLEQLLAAGAESAGVRRQYVMGASSRVYEEADVRAHWPREALAGVFADQAADGNLSPNFELEHLMVLKACLPDEDFEDGAPNTDAWNVIYGKIKDHLLVALLDPLLHVHACDVVRVFWLSANVGFVRKCIELTGDTLAKVFGILYADGLDKNVVDETTFLNFIAELKSSGGPLVEVALQQAVDALVSTNPHLQDSGLGQMFC